MTMPKPAVIVLILLFMLVITWTVVWIFQRTVGEEVWLSRQTCGLMTFWPEQPDRGLVKTEKPCSTTGFTARELKERFTKP